MLETCRRLGINDREHLKDVLPKLGGYPASRVAKLTPSAWKAAREGAGPVAEGTV